MRSGRMRAVVGRVGKSGNGWLSAVGRPVTRMVARRPLDCLAGATALALAAQISVNALVLQDARHPAPIFHPQPTVRAAVQGAAATMATGAAPQERTGSLALANQPPAERVKAVQAALAAAGKYDGPVDGAFGPRTKAAIFAYELAAGLPPTGEPSAAVLDHLGRAATPPAAVPMPRAKAEAPAASPRVLAVQKALAKLGYGPVRLDGVPGAATRQAIQRFEADRNLPVTGEMSPRVLKEMAAMSGASFE